MIALDTHVLVRFVVEDDLEQSRRAKVFIEEQFERGIPSFVPDVVLAELVWMLGFSYDVPRPKIVSLVSELLSARQLRFDAPERVSRALRGYAAGKGDFADYSSANRPRRQDAKLWPPSIRTSSETRA